MKVKRENVCVWMWMWDKHTFRQINITQKYLIFSHWNKCMCIHIKYIWWLVIYDFDKILKQLPDLYSSDVGKWSKYNLIWKDDNCQHLNGFRSNMSDAQRFTCWMLISLKIYIFSCCFDIITNLNKIPNRCSWPDLSKCFYIYQLTTETFS